MCTYVGKLLTFDVRDVRHIQCVEDTATTHDNRGLDRGDDEQSIDPSDPENEVDDEGSEEESIANDDDGDETHEVPEVPELVDSNKRARKKAEREAMFAAASKNKSKPKPGSGFAGVEGELNRAAASVSMAALFSGRLVRFDTLRPIQRLAENFHKWTPRHSAKLHRLIEYINSTADYKQYGFIGDAWEHLKVVV